MKKKVSLVLSGGGARGMAHIGVIEELVKEGFEIASVAGTSMGALVGAVYALKKMDAFKNWLFTLDRLKVFNLFDFTLSAQGFVKGDKVFNQMKEFIPDGNIEDLGISYAAVAADILNKEEVVFTGGSIYEAIRASVAIPTVFTPVKRDGRILVDGGILNNIPVNHVKRTPGDILVVVNVNADIPLKKPEVSKEENEKEQSVYQKKIKDFYNHLQKITASKNHEESMGYFHLINKTIGLMRYHMTQMTLQQHHPDILINVSQEACGIFDFFKAEEVVSIGKYAAEMAIGEYKKTGKTPAENQ